MGWDSPDQHGPERDDDGLLDADCRDWLDAHEATLQFQTGKKIALEVTRPRDGLKLQFSDWTLAGAVRKARDRLRSSESNSTAAPPIGGDGKGSRTT